MSRKIMGQGKLVLRRFDDSMTAETIGDLALATEGVETIDELRQLEASAAALYFGAWSGCSAQHLSRRLLRCRPVPPAEGLRLSLTLATSAAMPASPTTPQAPEIRGRRGVAIAARKRALSEWDKANPGVVYDPELFRREILPRLSAVKLSEIAEAAGCSKAYASDIRRGKWTPHISTWRALGSLVGMTQPALYAR